MSINKGKISMTEQYSVINKMKNEDTSAAASYRCLQGYTATPEGNQLFAMLKAVSQTNNSDQYSAAKLVDVSSAGTNISSKKTNLNHANDCTYYNGLYYVATMNSDKKIYAFRKDTLVKEKVFTYTGNTLSDISSIAHISGDYFLLGKGYKVALCKMYTSSNQFTEEESFTLAETGSSGEIGKLGLEKQGMYVSESGYLFKALCEPNQSGKIHKNYIAKWRLKGNSPSYNGSALEGLYDYTAPNSIHLFEFESVSAVPNRAMYAAVKTQQSSNSSEYNAKLYKISF